MAEGFEIIHFLERKVHVQREYEVAFVKGELCKVFEQRTRDLICAHSFLRPKDGGKEKAGKMSLGLS